MEKTATGKMTVAEAGRKGGEANAASHDHEHFVKIGKKGGQKGGQTTLERYGTQFYEEIGRKGGHKVRDLIAEAKAAREKRGE